MGWQAWTLAILIAVSAALQYALAWSAIADLLHRPRVRGGSHLTWILAILCVPILGPLVYGAIGPTSFRSAQVMTAPPDYDEAILTPTNVTPFRRSSGRLSDAIPVQRPGVTRSRAHSSEGAVSKIRRPGA